MSEPEVFVNKDMTKEGEQYWAEVVVNAGKNDERTLYSTSWHKTAKSAVKEANDWLKKK